MQLIIEIMDTYVRYIYIFLIQRQININRRYVQYNKRKK